MSTSTDTAAPAVFLPEIVTEIRADGTASMSAGGDARELATTPERIRAMCRDRWHDYAREHDRPVPVLVTDPEGEWRIIVQPTGDIVDPPGPVADLLPVPPIPPAAARRHRGRTTPTLARESRPVEVPERLRPTPPTPAATADLPTIADLRAQRTTPRAAPATRGWQGTVRRATFHAINPAPGEAEMRLRSYSRAVCRSLDTSKTIVLANPKGGAAKTSSATSYAATVAEERGGDILLWDNNPFMGNLAARAGATNPEQRNTVVELLRDLGTIDSRARLNNYLRTVEGQHFMVLASTEDPAKTDPISGDDFQRVHTLLSRWFSIIVVDTGNDITAANFRAAIDVADQVVVPISLGQAAIEGAAQVLAKLQAWNRTELARSAVGVMVRGNIGPNAGPLRLTRREAERQARIARDYFAPPAGWMRAVKEVPVDPALAFDRPIEYERLSRGSRDAWLEVAAAVADGL